MLRVNYFLLISGMFLLLFIAAVATAADDPVDQGINQVVEEDTPITERYREQDRDREMYQQRQQDASGDMQRNQNRMQKQKMMQKMNKSGMKKRDFGHRMSPGGKGAGR